MAITPRMILTQPAAASVAAIAVVGMTIFGTYAFDVLQNEARNRVSTAECGTVQGPSEYWTEAEWAGEALCFETHHRRDLAVATAGDGLRFYPESEVLYNIKGYNLIELGLHSEAVETLEDGLARVEPTDGVMQNNLAWSYLFLHQGHSPRVRELYLASLQKEPSACETLHTGLMVEFEVARNSAGIARAEALRAFQLLRNGYAACENRNDTWTVAVEAVGAGVLYAEVEKMLGSEFYSSNPGRIVHEAARAVDSEVFVRDPERMCREGMPMADLRPACERAVRSAFDQR